MKFDTSCFGKKTKDWTKRNFKVDSGWLPFMIVVPCEKLPNLVIKSIVLQHERTVNAMEICVAKKITQKFCLKTS